MPVQTLAQQPPPQAFFGIPEALEREILQALALASREAPPKASLPLGECWAPYLPHPEPCSPACPCGTQLEVFAAFVSSRRSWATYVCSTPWTRLYLGQQDPGHGQDNTHSSLKALTAHLPTTNSPPANTKRKPFLHTAYTQRQKPLCTCLTTYCLLELHAGTSPPSLR